ncbi:hypothetical protein T4E_1773 [Trichinella pseudospiralis]|uniref:Uncharacterized protein n=1 Tax=Trichinella pseudospiralis TaxID=6337 RepID=A0A0V0Y2X0_TRIPS|nr:hypothetical protein T4E_6798 [Trichinella pseudospiralis]KRX96200.1 hypothetical protein T4E_1773 [Trichinella pseudospiralis]
MNSVRHRVLNRLLYQALYGCNLMQNACKDHIPSEILRQADGEEELGNVIIQFRYKIFFITKTPLLNYIIICRSECEETNELNITTSTVIEYDDCTARGRME